MFPKNAKFDLFCFQPNMEQNRSLLARGNVDTVVISTTQSLGDLHHISICHNNFGTSPDWFLEYIVVQDKKSSREWKFENYKWLAVDRDECKIERKIPCSTKVAKGSFQKSFRSRASNSLYDGHLWLSAITKRPGSSFTRVQRITCCLNIALSAMMANALFYNVDGEAENTIRVGPLKISLRQIIVGFQSCLIAVPINILIIWLFKNAKDKRSRKHLYNLLPFDKENEQRLPHSFVYVAWFLCFGVSMTSALFTFFYSLMWGKEKANEWLTCMILSMAQDIFAIQPLKVVVTAGLVAFALTKAPARKKKPLKENDNSGSGVEANKQEGLFHDKEGPDKDELEWYKEERRKRLKFYAVV